jgi:hypothetical protein
MTRLLLYTATVLVLTILASGAQAEFKITDEMVGLVMQCGQAIITITPDKKLQATGLPYGDYPIDVKDGEIYLDGKRCKPICKAPAEKRC